MKVADCDGRAVVVEAGRFVDVHEASGGRFPAALPGLYDRWDEFLRWASGVPIADVGTRPLDGARFGPPSPAPRQVVAIGLNYSEHAAETGFGHQPALSAFTKFPSCLTGPRSTVELPPGGHVDWEVELVVVVIGRPTHAAAARDTWRHVAGVCVGQDLSERRLQMGADPPQFSLGKSFPGFGPIGPWLVTPDELNLAAGLELGCSINGEVVQAGNTRDMIRDVPALLETVSAVITLHPGDLQFTGTPPGVGLGRVAARWVRPGDVLESWVEGIGRLRQEFTAAPSGAAAEAPR